jgi:hypothetical protein
LEAYYDFVKKLVNAFESVKLDYAFTGALAVSFYGVPRTTTDVDVMLAVADETDLKRKITAALKQANLEAMREKLRRL